MNATKCAGLTRAGNPCKSFVYRDGLCRVHWTEAHGDGDELARIRADRARGGKASATLARARRELETAEQMTVGDALRLLSAATVRVYAGDMQPGVGTALASMVGTLVRVHHAETIEDQILELERYARIV